MIEVTIEQSLENNDFVVTGIEVDFPMLQNRTGLKISSKKNPLWECRFLVIKMLRNISRYSLKYLSNLLILTSLN